MDLFGSASSSAALKDEFKAEILAELRAELLQAERNAITIGSTTLPSEPEPSPTSNILGQLFRNYILARRSSATLSITGEKKRPTLL